MYPGNLHRHRSELPNVGIVQHYSMDSTNTQPSRNEDKPREWKKGLMWPIRVDSLDDAEHEDIMWHQILDRSRPTTDEKAVDESQPNSTTSREVDDDPNVTDVTSGKAVWSAYDEPDEETADTERALRGWVPPDLVRRAEERGLSLAFLEAHVIAYGFQPELPPEEEELAEELEELMYRGFDEAMAAAKHTELKGRL